MDQKKNESLKIILLGDSAVGKTKMIERYLMDNYHPQQMSTYAVTLFEHKTVIDGKEVEIEFWDTAGQERFNSLHPSYYFRSHCCILVFDVTRKQTYQNLTNWYKELQEHRKGIPVLLVANKIDVDFKVTEKSFGFATKRNIPLYYSSSSDGTNIVKIFEDAIRAAIKCREKPPSDYVSDVLNFIENK